MDRRTFAKILGGGVLLLAGAFGGGAVAYRLFFRRLQGSICSIADQRFTAAADQYDLPSLVSTLLQKGVLSASGAFHAERIRALAATDPLVIYDDFYYTETELQVYALAQHMTTRRSCEGEESAAR